MINQNNASRRRGRPPAFDRDDVLAKAAETFWRLGYEGASIVDLTDAMGITPQSLYAAFGAKAALYQEALEWYGRTFPDLADEAFPPGGVINGLTAWLKKQAALFTDPAYPPGCMIATALLGCAVENAPVAQKVSAMREATIAQIRHLLDRAKSEGELGHESDPAALARFIGAIIQGMSVQARDGASHAELRALVRMATGALSRHCVSPRDRVR